MDFVDEPLTAIAGCFPRMSRRHGYFLAETTSRAGAWEAPGKHPTAPTRSSAQAPSPAAAQGLLIAVEHLAHTSNDLLAPDFLGASTKSTTTAATLMPPFAALVAGLSPTAAARLARRLAVIMHRMWVDGTMDEVRSFVRLDLPSC